MVVATYTDVGVVALAKTLAHRLHEQRRDL
jgi:hypothetical protein